MKKTALFILMLTLCAGMSQAIVKKNIVVRPVQSGAEIFKPAALKVLTANGGETWGIGGYGHITWSATNVSQNLNVWIKVVGSPGIFMVKQDVPPGTLKAVYTIPANFGYSGKVFKVVVATVDGKVSDESDDTFTIRKMNINGWIKDSSEQQYNGPCPVTLSFSAQISVEFPCWVSYNLFFEDVSVSQTYKTFVYTVKDVVFSRTISNSLQGHITLSFLSPSKANSSNSAYFNVHCTETAK
jgi:hypothetical protein